MQEYGLDGANWLIILSNAIIYYPIPKTPEPHAGNVAINVIGQISMRAFDH